MTPTRRAFAQVIHEVKRQGSRPTVSPAPSSSLTTSSYTCVLLGPACQEVDVKVESALTNGVIGAQLTSSYMTPIRCVARA